MTDTPRRTELEELRALSDAATPGPFVVYDENELRAFNGDPLVHCLSAGDPILDRPDAAFIVAAVNYVRSLLRDSQR